MIEPVSGPSSHPIDTASQNVPQIAGQMQTQVTILTEQLQQAIRDPSLSIHPTFLNEMTSNAIKLHQTVKQALL